MGATAAVLEDLTAAFTRNVSYSNAPAWVSLHSANPGSTGTSELTSGTGASGRQQATFATGSGGTDTSSIALAFLMAGGGQNVRWIGYWTAQTGGTFLGGYPCVGTQMAATALFGVVSLSCPGNGLTVGQPVRLFTIPGVQSAIPTGFTFSTTYYVSAAAVDTLQLSATLGGGSITPSSSGGFVLAIDETASFASPGIFNISIGNLIYETVS